MTETVLALLGIAAMATPMEIEQTQQAFANEISDNLLAPMEIEIGDDRRPRRSRVINMGEYFRVMQNDEEVDDGTE